MDERMRILERIIPRRGRRVTVHIAAHNGSHHTSRMWESEFADWQDTQRAGTVLGRDGRVYPCLITGEPYYVEYHETGE